MADRALPLGLVGVVLVATAASVPAAERTSLAVSVDGSLPLSLSDNGYRNPAGQSLSDLALLPALGRPPRRAR